MTESVLETPAVDLPLWQLRENLIDLTIALADELAADGDTARLEALIDLYDITRHALQQRTWRGAR